jgi:hypothetical protein
MRLSRGLRGGDFQGASDGSADGAIRRLFQF